ncbi:MULTISPECIES: hypothetical protein, partial [unclassified Escherichia]|uniref:hypothetical protein n=1 Tax=unclassified Escherichia TaxID=2608889 RepID=UPI001C8E4842
ILRGVRQQQDEPGRFSICSRQAAVVLSVLGKKTSQNLEQARKTELKLRGRKMPLCLSGRHL